MLRTVFAVLLLFAATRTFAQYTLQGKIVNENGTGLAGASISFKESGYGTISGEDGNFRFTGLGPDKYTLVASFIGYEKYTESILLSSDKEVLIKLTISAILGDDIIVTATRAGSNSPMAVSNIEKEEIAVLNMGQDIPVLLAGTPSFVSTSDAGNGVGYTGFRIRGSDANRINVTVNGIPLNDAESHSVFWVNMPDFSSSLQSVQVQRGVGLSTNGAGAFGACINMETSTLNQKSYAELSLAGGSFNTFKSTLSLGSGLINEHLSFDVRLSKITSDGYIDRAWSDLKSFFVSGSYHTGKTVLKINLFSGKEHTYQAWNGVPSYLLETHRTYNPSGEFSGPNDETRYYNNESDNYQQDHYQLFFSRKFDAHFSMNLGLHYTYGRGYYENYKEDQNLADYQLNYMNLGDTLIEHTDLVQQKWLDNDFYGTTFSGIYESGRSQITVGGSWNKYDGRHFGKVIWAEFISNGQVEHEWYRGTGLKTDFSIYTRYNYQLLPEVNIYTDLQYRHVEHRIGGIDDDLRDITQSHTFDFFNPKMGINYQLNKDHSAYLLLAVGNREPNRSNYTDADPDAGVPAPERLYNYEGGYKYNLGVVYTEINLYFMDYKDQLILTGEINDVGAPIMVNAENSSRKGIEMSFGWKLLPVLSIDANASLSESIINDFTEYVDSYDENWNYLGQEAIHLGKTQIAFSPALTSSGQLTYKPFRGMSAVFMVNYVDKQYIDNAGSNSRVLEPYLLSNMKLQYTISNLTIGTIDLHLLLKNIFNYEYESNAWVYSYLFDNTREKMDGYFPQAGFHLMAGVDIKF